MGILLSYPSWYIVHPGSSSILLALYAAKHQFWLDSRGSSIGRSSEVCCFPFGAASSALLGKPWWVSSYSKMHVCPYTPSSKMVVLEHECTTHMGSIVQTTACMSPHTPSERMVLEHHCTPMDLCGCCIKLAGLGVGLDSIHPF